MKPGFTLIELTIGILLSGIIATALYNAFYVTHRVVDSSDNFIMTDFSSALLNNQLDKDFAGLFVPEEPDLIKTAADKKKVEENKEEPKKEKATTEENPPKPIEKVFYSTQNADGSLNTLTFITNNPVKIYEKAKNVSPKPHIVRVVYRLVAHEDNPKVMSLLRQESPELDFNAFDLKSSKQIRAYSLVDNIKNIKIEYTYPLQKEEQPQKKPAPKPGAQGPEKETKEEKPKPEYKTVTVWDVESKKEEHNEQPKIPQFIRVICELWDNQNIREFPYTFDYEIITFVANIKSKKPRKQPELKGPEKAEPNKPTTPPAPPQPTTT